MRAWLVAIAACGTRTPEVALPQVVTHPVYRVHAELPEGWVADAASAPIYPADSWMLHPADSNTPVVALVLGWLPRGGRQSAFFPGGREEGGRAETRTIGGASREGLRESNSFLVDFDVGELAVSVRTYATDDASRATVDAIVSHLAFDPAARAPDHPTPARRALELARGWARSHGYPTDNIVLVGKPGPFAFTVFHGNGLVPLEVDPDTSTVTQKPL